MNIGQPLIASYSESSAPVLPHSKEPVLKVRHLSTRLQLGCQAPKVVDDLSFDLFSGKTLALVGESGSGKSMTALSLMRILPTPPALPPEGKVWLHGEEIFSLSERRFNKIRGGKMAMIFQDPMTSLNPVYPIGDQLLEAASLHLGLYGQEAYERVLLALEQVHLPSPKERLYEYPHQLSGGMKQRVMIAMALIGQPSVLIADEPTTALDVTVQAQILDLIRQLQEETGMAVLLITHDMGVVAEMADEVLVMYASKVVERGPADLLFKNLSHPYTRGLFRSLPRREDTRQARLFSIPGTLPPVGRLPTGCPFHPRCESVLPKCHEEKPPEIALQSTEHRVTCWLYEDTKQERS